MWREDPEMSDAMKTPYFLVRQKILSQNIKGFQDALNNLWPNSLIAYSVKTNSLPWILGWMNRHDVYAEVVSDEEYQLALLSGYTADRIVFNGPIKTDKYLAKAFDGGSIINIDSQHELDYILRKKSTVKGCVGIRVNMDPKLFPGDDVGYQENGFRFGFSDENGELGIALDLLKQVYGDIPFGLHMHVNSITRSPEIYQVIAAYAAKIIKKYKMEPAYVDIGGGFFGGVPGKTKPEEYISVIRKQLEDTIDISRTKLVIEPGSAAVGSAIEMHTSVIDVKDTVCARIVTTDGSRIHIDPLWLKKRYLYTTTVQEEKPKYPKQIICGYTCMDRDRIMTIENEPELSVGDQIIYHRVGNYTVTFGGPFIKPFPPVYAETESGIELIRKQMTMEEYYRMETK